MAISKIHGESRHFHEKMKTRMHSKLHPENEGKTIKSQMSYSVGPRMVLDQPPCSVSTNNDTSIWVNVANLERLFPVSCRLSAKLVKSWESRIFHHATSVQSVQSTFRETPIWGLRIALNPLINHHWLMIIIDYHQLVKQ